jgi:teichuronic acid biosynthesis glycosyltransferase TuaC
MVAEAEGGRAVLGAANDGRAPLRSAGAMRALILTNMYPSAEHPALGSFVRDQAEALSRIPDIELELAAFEPGDPAAYARAAADLFHGRDERFDIVHAHFGLTAWPGLAVKARHRLVTLHGTDLMHPRSRVISLAALRFYDQVAVVSSALAREVPGWATRREPAVLPCGVDMHRFNRIPRDEARRTLGLDLDGPYLLFPADPARPEKRYDRAREVAGETPLLALGDVPPSEVPQWVNAANAVVMPSEREGFGLGVLEALACDVPVIATPVGIAPEALAGIGGSHCLPFDAGAWREALAPHLAASDPRVDGRTRADEFSTDRMAARVVSVWRMLG